MLRFLTRYLKTMQVFSEYFQFYHILIPYRRCREGLVLCSVDYSCGGKIDKQMASSSSYKTFSDMQKNNFKHFTPNKKYNC